MAKVLFPFKRGTRCQAESYHQRHSQAKERTRGTRLVNVFYHLPMFKSISHELSSFYCLHMQWGSPSWQRFPQLWNPPPKRSYGVSMRRVFGAQNPSLFQIPQFERLMSRMAADAEQFLLLQVRHLHLLFICEAEYKLTGFYSIYSEPKKAPLMANCLRAIKKGFMRWYDNALPRL